MTKPACEHAGVIRRLHTSLMLADDLDLEEMRARYAGLDRVETLIDLAVEMRVIERVLGGMNRGSRLGRRVGPGVSERGTAH